MKTTIGVFFGGRSTEHEISVLSACQAMAAVDKDRYEIVPVYISKQGHWYTGQNLAVAENYRDIDRLIKDATEVYMRPVYGDYKLYPMHSKGLFGGSKPVAELDVVLPILHGSNGEDGNFQGVLNTIGIPFAGCDTLASANGMDKITMKMILAAEGIPVVDYVWFTDKQWSADGDALTAKIEGRLGYPVIVKPANLGSSVGIGCAADRNQLRERVADASRYSSRIIVEKMVRNLQEINCSVLGDCDNYETSVLEEPVKSGEILSYMDKYLGGEKTERGMQAARKRIPADLPPQETERIRFLAGETFRVLGCNGVSRVDVMVDGDTREIFVNEINTIPGSLSFYLWEAAGVPFGELIDRLVKLAFKRKREADGKTVSYSSNIFALGGGIKGAKGSKLK